MTLADRQAELVRALVAGGELPSGFDPDDVAVATRALLRKRAGEVAHHFPTLRYELGDRYLPLFCAWAAGRPKTTSVADGRAFAEHAGISLPTPPGRLRRWSRAVRTFGRRADEKYSRG